MVSLFTNSVIIFVMIKAIIGNGIFRFYSLGLITYKRNGVCSEDKNKLDIFSDARFLPQIYILFLNLILILFAGNSEIIGRVAYTNPVYHWACS